MSITEFNRFAWDRQVERGNEWTRPVSAEEIAAAKAGQWSIVLTPTKPVPREWLPPLKNLDLLCLASGGGQQGPILAAAGANVTVYDNSPKQLEQDRLVAVRDNLGIRTVQGDMADLGVFASESFDAIVHPVSNVFVPSVLPVWKECFRVLRKSGVLVAGFTNPVVHLIDYDLYAKTGRVEVRFPLPYSDVETLSPEQRKRNEAEGLPLEFGHTLADQIGGQLACGFVITGFYEDRDKEGSDNPLMNYTGLYIATRALKPIL
jgi:SAM-dependent methyltransferase